MTTHSQWLRLAPFVAGLRVSSLPLWWLGSDLRFGHFFSFCRSLVNTPQLNTPLLNCLLNSLTTESLMNSRINYVSLFYKSGPTEQRSPPRTVCLLFGVYPLLRNELQSRSNAVISISVSVSADTCFNGPLSSSGLFWLSGVMSQYIFYHLSTLLLIMVNFSCAIGIKIRANISSMLYWTQVGCCVLQSSTDVCWSAEGGGVVILRLLSCSLYILKNI
jgi:hypothetical protein